MTTDFKDPQALTSFLSQPEVCHC